MTKADERGSPTGPARRHRVLIVDDDLTLRETTAALLEERYEVEVAATPAEALRALQRRTFEVVLSDYEMPGGSGIDLLRAVRDLGQRPAMLLVSGHRAIAAEATKSGLVHAVLFKPLTRERLFSAIDGALTLAEMRRAFESAATTFKR